MRKTLFASLGMVAARASMMCLAAVVMITAPAAAWREWLGQDDIAALFPAPLDGWTVEDVAIEKRDTVTSGFEAFAVAPLAETATAGVSVRLKVTRIYSQPEKSITISIDTEDIESAVSVDGMSAAYTSDADARARLEHAGIIPFERDGYPGLKLAVANEAGRVFKVGSAGVLSLQCAYPDCGADLDAMTARLDFSAIAEFVAFDHRR
ncbi:hypothetical protein ACFOOP_10955 [Marinicaulis aureus]|uniref:Uncharacterized protein n=1 Tax=Hyphococcus aureus TaxID=2666033 RepID=A0ABW1KZW7_9PROT